ncbi:peptidase M1, membrane alanine aminopeptidase, partial [Neoconidiobolus thromboides FSU 785]
MQDQPNLLPTSVKPTHYNLTLHTDIDNFSFNGLIKINLVINESIDIIKFNTKHLVIQEANLHEDSTLSTIKVTSINYDTEEQTCSLKLSENLKQGKNMILELRFSGILNRAMTGFYASSYESLEGKEAFMASTHFE